MTTGATVMHLIPNDDANCSRDGNCKTGDNIEYQSRDGGVFTASLDNLPPVVALSITGTLHNGPLQIEQTCDPQGNCNSPSASTWAFAPGEQITLDPHAFSPEHDRDISEVDWLVCVRNPPHEARATANQLLSARRTRKRSYGSSSSPGRGRWTCSLVTQRARAQACTRR